MSPTPAHHSGTITAMALCEKAARVGRSFDREEARTALGAISNMYCLYALQNGATDIATTMRAFSAERIAERRAVLLEIQKAVPRADAQLADHILAGLAESLDHIFIAKEYGQALLPGFGVLAPIDVRRSEYRLNVELPLARFLRSAD